MTIEDFLCDDLVETTNRVSQQEESYDVIPCSDDEQILQEMLDFKNKERLDKFQSKVIRRDIPIDKTTIAHDEVDNILDLYISSKFKSIPSFKSILDPLKGRHAKQLKEILDKSREEISSVLTTNDEDLIDAYSNFSKSEIKKIVGFYDAIISACDVKIGIAQKLRKPRKKKEVPLEKLLANVQYCEEFKELNLKSIHPQEIIGASRVWVYNTTYKKLGCYQAQSQDGFSIKGTTILNFNESKSIQKVLRKPKEVLTKVVNGDKVVLSKIMASLRTTEIKLTGRLNRDTVILRIIL